MLSPNIHNDFHAHLRSILGIKLVNNLGFYLSVPSCFSSNKSKDLNYIVDKIGKATQIWKVKLLSFGGRKVLIKSIAQALPVYLMSCFQLPKKIYKDINKILANFW